MLDLPTVTLLVIDTANHALALRALARCQAQVNFGRTLFLTDAVPPGIAVPAGVEIATIAPIESRADYSAFVLKQLLPYASTPHLLLAQWDGFVVNAGAFQPAFLDCDYIGAKWFWQPAGRRVGNGGFSLRSRRLLDALQDPRVVQGDNEDLTIGDTFRPLLESSLGIRFADEATADRFAFEAAHPIGKPFGFHGLFNFCRVMPASDLAALAPQFSDAIGRSPQLAQLLRNCIAMGQWPAAIAIARRRLAALPADVEAESLLAQAEAAARRTPAAGRNVPVPAAAASGSSIATARSQRRQPTPLRHPWSTTSCKARWPRINAAISPSPSATTAPRSHRRRSIRSRCTSWASSRIKAGARARHCRCSSGLWRCAPASPNSTTTWDW
jgi:hypothetical protein